MLAHRQWVFGQGLACCVRAQSTVACAMGCRLIRCSWYVFTSLLACGMSALAASSLCGGMAGVPGPFVYFCGVAGRRWVCWCWRS